MLLYGYARVSTPGQTLEAQLEQLRAAGCRKVYREKASGARADRRQLKRLLKALSRGDTVVVTRIDRLARSTFDSRSSSAPSIQGRIFARWPSLGLTRAPAPEGL
jgi:DNA invertase Pin-like site-specific DNA recombinase